MKQFRNSIIITIMSTFKNHMVQWQRTRSSVLVLFISLCLWTKRFCFWISRKKITASRYLKYFHVVHLRSTLQQYLTAFKLERNVCNNSKLIKEKNWKQSLNIFITCIACRSWLKILLHTRTNENSFYSRVFWTDIG